MPHEKSLSGRTIFVYEKSGVRWDGCGRVAFCVLDDRVYLFESGIPFEYDNGGDYFLDTRLASGFVFADTVEIALSLAYQWVIN
jgi:hypothetical protein